MAVTTACSATGRSATQLLAMIGPVFSGAPALSWEERSCRIPCGCAFWVPRSAALTSAPFLRRTSVRVQVLYRGPYSIRPGLRFATEHPRSLLVHTLPVNQGALSTSRRRVSSFWPARCCGGIETAEIITFLTTPSQAGVGWKARLCLPSFGTPKLRVALGSHPQGCEV